MQTHMAKYCWLHDVHFDDLMDTEAEVSGVNLEGKVNLILTDPPYNVRNSRNRKNSDHDVLTEDDMADCVKMFAKMLVPGGHGLLFCANLQFPLWHNLLKNYTQEEDDESDTDSGKAMPHEERRRTPKFTFGVEDIALNYIRASKHYILPPGVKRIVHASIVEHAIHFWKRGEGNNEALNSTDYQLCGYINSNHAAWTNVMDNIPKLPHHEKVFVKDAEGKDVMLRPEQKNIAWMKEIISQFTVKGDIVVDPFAGTFSTAKACMDLPEHRIFVGGEVDDNCVREATPSVLEYFCKQAVNKNSNISLTVEAENDVKHYCRLVLQRKNGEGRYEVPDGLPSYQRFPSYITSMYGEMIEDGCFLEKYRAVPLDKWPRHARSSFYSIPCNLLRSLEVTVKGLSIRKSTIRHPTAGNGLFTNRVIGTGEMIITYYGSLVYADLSRSRKGQKYGEGVFEFDVDYFHKRAIQLKSTAKDSTGMQYPIFIVPAPFCAAVYINDPRYIVGDEEQHLRNSVSARKANVELVESSGTISRDFLRRQNLITVRALRQIIVGEELFIDYGDRFMF